MILKEHPLRYTATQIRRSIERLETFSEMNSNEAIELCVHDVIAYLKETYILIPKEYRK